MNKQTFVIVVVLVAVLSFAAGTYFYKPKTPEPVQPQPAASATQPQAAPAADVADAAQGTSLIRTYSPVIGRVDAPVTIVEFLDPSCEACRAFFPTVEGILEKYPQDVRVVVRYAPFHPGSAEAIGILEAARKQDLFLPVLSALFARQQEWAIHGAPDLEKAWDLAREAGMDVDRGKRDAVDPAVMKVIEQDVADIQTMNVRGTPTFYIDGALLTNFGQQQLIDAVDAQVALTKNSSAQ